MAITVEEQYGRRLSGKTSELVYLIQGTGDAIAARAALLAESPASYNGQPRQLDQTDVEEIRGLIGGGFIGNVHYGYSQKQTSTSGFEFNTSGGTQHITQSKGTTKYAPSGSTAPDFHGAIGVADKTIQGVDIPAPSFDFTVTRYIPSANMTEAYLGTLYALTGTINNGAWSVTTDDGVTIGLAEGEGLFKGAAGSYRSDQSDWEVRFTFAASPNATGLIVGDITGITKRGWDYLWVRYEHAEDTDAKALVRKPIAAYVEVVFDETDFSQLNL